MVKNFESYIKNKKLKVVGLRARRLEPNKSFGVSKRSEMKSDNKISMRLVQRPLYESPLNETVKRIIDKPQRRHLTNDTAEEKDYSEARDVMETSKKISRPIGVTRPPEESKKKPREETPQIEKEEEEEETKWRKEKFLQVKKDLPESKEELEELLKRLKHETIIYHSLCKRWKKVNEQMTKEIINQEISPPEESYKDPEVPTYRSYNLGFHLNNLSSPSPSSSLSLSDEFLGQENREVLIHKNEAKLYFNLHMDHPRED